MESFYKNKAYIFLQIKVTGYKESEDDHRFKRQKMLEIACGAVKNKFKHLNTIVGITTDAPKYSESNSEDFILMDCSYWSDEDKEYYEKLNESFGFLKSENLKMNYKNVKEFPDSI